MKTSYRNSQAGGETRKQIWGSSAATCSLQTKDTSPCRRRNIDIHELRSGPTGPEIAPTRVKMPARTTSLLLCAANLSGPKGGNQIPSVRKIRRPQSPTLYSGTGKWNRCLSTSHEPRLRIRTPDLRRAARPFPRRPVWPQEGRIANAYSPAGANSGLGQTAKGNDIAAVLGPTKRARATVGSREASAQFLRSTKIRKPCP